MRLTVSAHLGARTGDGGEDHTNHFWWQGKFYRLDDEDGGNGETTVETIGRSLGAKARNYDVYNPITDEFINLAEGTRITQPKNHVMAGRGRKRKIDDIDWLLDRYGGDALKWTKEKGFGYVLDEFGEKRKVELHWYQEPTVGKVEMKIKPHDGRLYLEDD